MSKVKILLTNDDGIDSTGLRYLWESLREIGDLYVVAPNAEKSGSGVGVTFDGPLSAVPVESYQETPAWKVGGTPADCVKLAVGALLSDPPDLIVSGINHGSNAGRNVLYSGTIGGVIEGVLRGIPGAAFSYVCSETPAFAHVKESIPQIIKHLLNHPLQMGSFLNVNFPHTQDGKFKGYRMARQGMRYWIESPQHEIHPEKGHSQYWMPGTHSDHDEHELSDIAYLDQGYITAVPLHVNELTDHIHLAEKKKIFEDELN